jgi:hypothetical protein
MAKENIIGRDKKGNVGIHIRTGGNIDCPFDTALHILEWHNRMSGYNIYELFDDLNTHGGVNEKGNEIIQAIQMIRGGRCSFFPHKNHKILTKNFSIAYKKWYKENKTTCSCGVEYLFIRGSTERCNDCNRKKRDEKIKKYNTKKHRLYIWLDRKLDKIFGV